MGELNTTGHKLVAPTAKMTVKYFRALTMQSKGRVIAIGATHTAHIARGKAQPEGLQELQGTKRALNDRVFLELSSISSSAFVERSKLTRLLRQKRALRVHCRLTRP